MNTDIVTNCVRCYKEKKQGTVRGGIGCIVFYRIIITIRWAIMNNAAMNILICVL